ncbi:hypothetical protein C8J57DRAFT_1521836 [Mycena rebaudengoi]|nr:hypothetical protein C8J57DRAFT_1521836 [Mycena rebaudengoi]
MPFPAYRDAPMARRDVALRPPFTREDLPPHPRALLTHPLPPLLLPTPPATAPHKWPRLLTYYDRPVSVSGDYCAIVVRPIATCATCRCATSARATIPALPRITGNSSNSARVPLYIFDSLPLVSRPFFIRSLSLPPFPSAFVPPGERSCIPAVRSFRRVNCTSARAPADTVGRARAAVQDQPHTCLRSRNRGRSERGRLASACRRSMLARGSAAQSTGAGGPAARFVPSSARAPVAGAESRGRILHAQPRDATQTANPLSPAPALVLPTRPTRRTSSRSHRCALQVRRSRRVHKHEGPPACQVVQTAHMDAQIPHRDAPLHQETSSAHGDARAPLSHPLPPLPPPKRPRLLAHYDRLASGSGDYAVKRSVPGGVRGVLLRDVRRCTTSHCAARLPQPCRVLLAAAAIACAPAPCRRYTANANGSSNAVQRLAYLESCGRDLRD